METVSVKENRQNGKHSDWDREAVKKLITDEIKHSLDEELRKAAQELQEEQRKAIHQIVEDQRMAIREVVEQEKKAIWAKADELKKSILDIEV